MEPRCPACGSRLDLEPDGSTGPCRHCSPTIALGERSVRALPHELEQIARALCRELAEYDAERLHTARNEGRVREELADAIEEARQLFVARAGVENLAAFEAAVDAVLVLGDRR